MINEYESNIIQSILAGIVVCVVIAIVVGVRTYETTVQTINNNVCAALYTHTNDYLKCNNAPLNLNIQLINRLEEE